MTQSSSADIDETTLMRRQMVFLLATHLSLSDPAIVTALLARGVAERKMRLGQLLDEAARLMHVARPRIPCGPFQLASADCLLYRNADMNGAAAAPVRLTEKERDILVRLYEANGTGVPRAQLLADVWGYGPAIETHTLETHIYRLRQKIEADPAAPQWLVNDGDAGYRLARP